MKKLILIFLLTIPCLFILNSCSKTAGTASGLAPTTTTTTTTTGDFVTLMVDGVSKAATSEVTVIYTSGNSFQLIGQLAGTENVGLMVNNVSVGNFDILAANAILSYGLDSTYANTFVGTTGSLTITSLTSTTIAGTFKFTGVNPAKSSKSITTGSFSCHYLKI